MKRTIAILTTLLLTACAGTMQGQIRGGKPVQFAYQEGMFDSGTITATLPDGEVFTGKFVNKNSEANFGMWGANSNGVFGGGGGSGTTYSGEMLATLLGNKGHTMQCVFTPNGTGLSLVKSGVGKCEVSDGRKIDVIF